ncbi:hypothetical protein ACH79_18455 [Bradyrhizobium sp. CCBAU 051011]|nr:hypothetical protein ACH79_18455 [Bradyrhizobium sp. CCBAU 051011]
MFVRFTRSIRAKAGWFVALLYLFCVLAPGVALAVGDAASCLLHQIPPAAVHVHEDASHEHHEVHGNQQSSHHADADRTEHDHAKHGHGKTLPGPCCAMLCLSALPADLPGLAKPSQPTSICVLERFQRLPGEPPPLHYRPPIA